MKKIIKRQGNSLIVTIDSEDRKIFKLKEGDIIDIEICKISSKDGKGK